MTDLRKLHEAATPVPWEVEGLEGYITGRLFRGGVLVNNLPKYIVGDTPLGMGVITRTDAALIAATRNALPYLLDVVEAARLVAEHAGHDSFECHAENEIRAAHAALAALDAHLRGDKP